MRTRGGQSSQRGSWGDPEQRGTGQVDQSGAVPHGRSQRRCHRRTMHRRTLIADRGPRVLSAAPPAPAADRPTKRTAQTGGSGGFPVWPGRGRRPAGGRPSTGRSGLARPGRSGGDCMGQRGQTAANRAGLPRGGPAGRLSGRHKGHYRTGEVGHRGLPGPGWAPRRHW